MCLLKGSQLRILIVTNYDFSRQRSGALNRVLELAKCISRFALIKIVHQGPDMSFGDLEVIGFANPISRIFPDASPYTTYIAPDFFRVMKSAIVDVDIVQVEQPYLLLPTIIASKILRKNPIVILDEHNVDFLSVRSKIGGFSFNSFLTLTTLPYIFFCERIAVSISKLILCVSDSDQKLFEQFYGVSKDRVVVLPNGVNCSKFERTSNIKASFRPDRFVFFHGTLSWYPNLEAANIILDYIAPRIPEATFIIAGPGAP